MQQHINTRQVQEHLEAGQEEPRPKASLDPLCPSRFLSLLTDALTCIHTMSGIMPCICLSEGCDGQCPLMFDPGQAVCLSVCLSVSLLVCLFVFCLSICLSVSPSVFVCLSVSVCLSICLPGCLHIRQYRTATLTLNAQVGGAKKPETCIYAFGSAVQFD